MASKQLPSFQGMIGRSAAMQPLYRRIERVAPIDVPVLIRGESGTGKELVASAIQQLSARRRRPFEIVNCGALTRELLPSELFGHERGAFTGAVSKKVGLLAVAHGGALFLDEVGELLPEAQTMLLRFLERREIQPVGSTRPIRVDVRLIAATHRDLAAAIERGVFREDLYYRLRNAVLEVPPLRARRDDIPLLVEHFLVQFNERYRLSVNGVTEQTFRIFDKYPWRGNVRELEAVLEQAMIFQSGGWVRPEDLDLPAVWPGEAVAKRPGGAHPTGAAAIENLTWYQQEALRITAARGAVRRRDLMAHCGISRGVARRELAALVDLGLLRRIGTGRGARYIPGPGAGAPP